MMRARVVILVDAMSEAHQAKLACLHALDVFRHLIPPSNSLPHSQDHLIGRRRVAVRKALPPHRLKKKTDQSARCRCCAIALVLQFLFVISVKNKEPHSERVPAQGGFVFQLRCLEHHVRKLPSYEIVIGLGITHSDPVAIGEGGNRRNFAIAEDLFGSTITSRFLSRQIEVESARVVASNIPSDARCSETHR